MGVGVSGWRLASAVANAGGIGIISGAQIGYRENDFSKDALTANLRALADEIRKGLADLGVTLEDTPRGTRWKYG